MSAEHDDELERVIDEATADEGEGQDVDDADPIGESGEAEGGSDDREGNVLRLLPVHAAPRTGKNDLKVTRQRGRPRKVERMPTTSDLEYHAEMSNEKQKFVQNDPILRAALGKADSAEILHLVKAEVAKESAALQFQRIENEKLGKDTAQISTRRIDALTKIANIELEIKKLGGDLLDLHSEKFQAVFKLWVQSVLAVAGEVLKTEELDLLTNRLMTKLEGWEERASVQLAKR